MAINQWLKLTIKAHQLSMGKRHTQYVSIWFDTVSINFIFSFFFFFCYSLDSIHRQMDIHHHDVSWNEISVKNLLGLSGWKAFWRKG